MTAMQAETLAGLMGLTGAAVGATGALMGGWLQQRLQSKAAREQQREERRYIAGQTALDMLIRLRRTAASRVDSPESEDDWIDVFVEHTTAYEAALLLIPDADHLRERLYAISRALGHYESLGQSHQDANLWLDSTALEAIRVLSAFLRQEPLPNPSHVFLEQQGMIEAHYRNTGQR
ncbi:hypothetical protein ABZ837_27520 [Streptomyces sp. NPDC047197]|uniref:hypothetical protein n=1 Tax=Streptomyces sp. NPDC047197 TaxID=3155477 RepID=UPI0033C4B970